jgi:MFS family permease
MRTESIASRCRPWLVCLTAALFLFYENIQMNMFNIMNVDLMNDFNLNATGISQLSAFYFYGNLLFLPIAGHLLDRFSTRLIILLNLLLSIPSLIAFSYTHSLGWAQLFRAISGIGSAFCFLSSVRLATRWFQGGRLSIMLGLVVSMGMLGGMAAQFPLERLLDHFGWRHSLLIGAGFGCLITGLIFYYVSDTPTKLYCVPDKKTVPLTLFKTWWLAYTNVQNWLAGFYTSLMNLPFVLLGALGGSLALQTLAGFSRQQSSIATGLLFVGAIAGGPIVGWLSNSYITRLNLMRLGAAFSLILVTPLIYYQPLSFAMNCFLFFMLGVVTSTQILGYPLVAENNPPHIVATAVSAVSFLVISGFAVFQPLFGRLLDLGKHGVAIYTAADYHEGLFILPLGIMVALILTWFIRERKR